MNGYFIASNHVVLSAIPTHLDRSLGDVHANGNPHIQTSPINILLVAEALKHRLQQLDVANSDFYEQRWQDFSQRWKTAIEQWQHQALPLTLSKDGSTGSP